MLGALSVNHISEELLLTFKLRLPLVEVEVEVCLWGLEDELAFSLVPEQK